MHKTLIATLAALLVTHAAHAEDMRLERMGFSALPGWQSDNHGWALEAFQRSCQKLLGMPSEAPVGQGLLQGKASDWQKACRDTGTQNPNDAVGARVLFEREFVPFAVSTDQKNYTGTFTGYYEPQLKASRSKKTGYNEPVYGRPDDLPGDGSAYPLTRSDIENGALTGKGLEKLYAEDPVELFFMQVQGSGRVVLDTGEEVALRFDGKNNQPYTAIGKVLVERGELKREEVSAPRIKQWLRDHPKDARALMRENRSFVFFDIVPLNEGGPLGAQNVNLLPERSLAVDPQYIPLGMPVYISTNLPKSAYGRGETYSHLMIAQDKGTAIKGPIRGDIFFGFGERAEDLAGHMNSKGRIYVLVPRDLASRLINVAPDKVKTGIPVKTY